MSSDFECANMIRCVGPRAHRGPSRRWPPATSAGPPCWSARCRCRSSDGVHAKLSDDNGELAANPQVGQLGVRDQAQAFADEQSRGYELSAVTQLIVQNVE